MLQLTEERKPPITPQLALRVAIIGGIALALFAIIFFRLWYLQVLSGDKYLAEANDNRVRDVVIAAPRGDIVDRGGRVMVENRVSIAVQVKPQELPKDPEARLDVLQRLSKVIGVSMKEIETEIEKQQVKLPFSNVTLKADVPRDVVQYLGERQADFPGVTANQVYLRSYPYDELAAQMFGTVGEISAEELKLQRFRGVQQGTIVGKGGIEFTYDRYLRGRNGAARLQVDALGRPKGDLRRREPKQGRQLRLSVDLDLQRAGQEAMSSAAGIPITDGAKNRGGAFVAMDPENGEILAMGSYPSFDPNLFAKPIKPRVFNALNSEERGAPLVDRAISALYPTGSTFKLITAAAALEEKLISPETVINDPGSIQIGNITFQNAGKTPHGAINMTSALKVSSDVYFYRLGQQADQAGGNLIQNWAKRLGMGATTGIDLPGEAEGLIPTPAWRNRLFRQELTDRPWSVGDNVNFSVGQGDLQATPLQMAVAYSIVANGGRVITPHLGQGVEDAAGRALERIEPAPSRRVDLSEQTRTTILNGLKAAASEEDGTSADVFKGFPKAVFGKTGTAERAGQEDQSWYIAYVPDEQRPIVVAVTVEQGGFGAETAAPAARLILSEWFGVEKEIKRGSSQTR